MTKSVPLAIGSSGPTITSTHVAGHWLTNFSITPTPYTSYDWYFSMGSSYSTWTHFTTSSGTYNGSGLMPVHWRLYITNACGTASINNYDDPSPHKPQDTAYSLEHNYQTSASELDNFDRTGQSIKIVEAIGNIDDNVEQKYGSILYPNPASTELFVKINRNQSQVNNEIEIKINDINGKNIDFQKVDKKVDVVKFDISKLAPGGYFVEINDQSGKQNLIFTKK